MATSTFGSNAASSLPFALVFNTGTNLTADVATVQQAIKDDLTNTHPVLPGAWSSHGLLYIPNRGVLQVRQGDWVAVDTQGWPILVSANSIANAPWTHAP